MAGDLNLLVDLSTQQAASQINKLWNEFKSGSQEAGDRLNRLLGGSIEKKVRIRLEKDTAGIKQVNAELIQVRTAVDSIQSAYNRLNKTQPGSLTSLRQQVNEAKRARDAISLFGNEIDKVSKKEVLSGSVNKEFLVAQQNVSRLTQELRTLELATASTFDKFKASLGLDQFLRFGRGVQDLVTIFQSLGIAISALTAPINQAASALARLQGLELAFKAIGAGAGGAAIALSESKRIALGLGVGIDTVRAGFQKLSPVVLNSGGTLNDVSAIIESLSSRFAAFGLNADESRRVLNGVIQAFAKGKLQAEELTQQISEADPAFKTDLAKALLVAKNELGDLGKEVDGTVANLEGLVKAGKLTSDVLIKVLPALSKSTVLFGKLGPTALSAVESLGKTGTTITQVRTQIDNLNQLNLEKFAKVFEPVIRAFLSIQASVTDFITRISQLGIIEALAQVISRVAQGISNLTQFILNGIEGFIRFADIVGKVLNLIGRFLGPIANFVSGLAQIPGVLETIGLLLLAKFVKPAKEAITSITSLADVFNVFGKKASQDVISPDTLSRPIEQGLARATSSTKQRLAELRKAVVQEKAVIAEPISAPPVITPKKYGISAKIIREVRESEESIFGLFKTLRSLEDELNALSTAGGRKQIFNIEAGDEIKALQQGIKDARKELAALGDVDLEGDSLKRYVVLTRQINQYKDEITDLASKVKDVDFVPDFDQRRFSRVEKELNGTKKLIDNIAKVRDFDIAVYVNDADVLDAIKNGGLLRSLYAKKLELEARLQYETDTPELLRELESVKKQIRAIGKIELPLELDDTASVQAVNAINSSKKEINDITKQLILGEDNYYKALKNSVSQAESAVKIEKERLSLSSSELERSVSRTPTEQRDAYEAELASLNRLQKALDTYTGAQLKSFSAGSQAIEIADKYSNKLLTQDQALGLLSRETAKYATLQSGIQSEIKNTVGTISELESGLSKARAALATTSFKSLGSEAVKSEIASITSELDRAKQKLNVLTTASSEAEGQLKLLGSTTQRIGDAEFRIGEKIQSGIKVASGAFETLQKSTNATFRAVQSGITGFGDRLKNAFTNIKTDGLKASLAGITDRLKAVGKIDVGRALNAGFVSATNNIRTFAQSGQRAIGTFTAGAVARLRGFGVGLVNTFRGLGSSIKGVFAALGPELAIFAAIALATTAYNKATERTKQINDEAAESVANLTKSGEGLDKTLASLSGKTASSNIPDLSREFSSFDKVLLSIGNTILSVQKGFEQLFSGLDSGGGKADTAAGKFNKVLLSVIGFAAAGAAIGSLIPAIGTGIGALAGAGVGLFVGLTASTEDWKFALEEAKKELDALVKSAASKAGALTQLADKIARQAKEVAALDAKATGAGKGQNTISFKAEGISSLEQASNIVSKIKADIVSLSFAQKAANDEVARYGQLQKRYSELYTKQARGGLNNEQITAIRNELIQLEKELKKGEQGFFGSKQAAQQYGQAIDGLKVQLKLAELAETKIRTALGLTQKEFDKIKQTNFNTLKENLSQLEAQIQALNLDKSADIRNLAQQAGALKANLQALENVAEQGRLEGYFRRTNELLAQGKINSSLKVTRDLISNLQSQIDLLDFSKPEDAAQIDALATKMGRLSAIVEVVENSVQSNKLAGYIEQIKLGLANDEIPRSLTTIGNLLQALEQRQVLIDIDSPDFVNVTRDILQVRQGLDQITGKKADITLKLIEEGIANGSIVRTLNAIDQQLEALNQKKVTLRVNSAEYVQTIEKIQEVERYRQLSEMTTDQLQERKFNIQKERLDTIASLEKAASDRKIALIDREIDKVRTYYDEQIKALEKLKGPAEQELEALKFRELQEKAAKGGREGLEARAELERLAREKQIARLREEQAAKLKQLEDRKRAEQERLLDREISVAEERLALEEQIAAIRLKSLGAEEADIDKILREREQGGAMEAGSADGSAYGNAFKEAARPLIDTALPNENDPASRVQFNYDNSQVLAAKDQVIQKESEYQQALRDTDALRQQLDAAPAGSDQSAIIDQIIAKENELTQISAQQYEQEQAYNQALRDTATITGDIVITNETLAQSAQGAATSVGEIETSAQGASDSLAGAAEGVGAVKDGADEAKTSFYDLNEAAGGTQEAVDNSTGSLDNLKDRAQEAGDAVTEIKEGAEKASGKFDELSDSVANTGDKAKTTGDSFDAATTKVEQGLRPALEKIPATLTTIANKMNEIFEREYTVNVRLNVQRQGVWTGGPVTKGTTYTVNELGQEGFMNRFGNISPIKKPRYGTWRPPSDGFVIPADIYSQMKGDAFKAPKTSVSHHTPSTSSGLRRDNSIKEIAKVFASITNGLSTSNNSNMDELSRVQAYQAKEIGKLSRAVRELSEKDWNVKVGIRNTGGSNGMKLSTYRI